MSIIYQLYSTIILCYVSMTMGILCNLPSSTLKIFSSENTTLDRVMTETELSFMGSISSVGALIATPFCGYFMDTFGRKRALILFYLPQMLSWMVLVNLFKVEAFIFAMLINGLSGCILLIVPVYVNEFCNPSFRGALSSISIIFYQVGMLLSYLFGDLLDYNTMNYTGLTLSVVGFALLFLLKESPLYLMKKGFEQEAALSIAFYNRAKPNDKEVLAQMDNIKRLLNCDIEQDGVAEEKKLKPKENEPKEKNTIIWKFLAKSPSTRRALFCVFVLCFSCIFQGIVVVQIYARFFLEATIPSMTGTLSSVLFASISIGASFIGAYLIDTFGRRILLIVSSIATCLLCVAIGTNIQFLSGPSWLSAVLLYLYVVTFTVGPGAVPIVLVGEVFLPEIKAFATTVCVEWCFTCNFIILFIFNPLFNAYGPGPLFYLFACFSLFTTIFSFKYVPETKCLPVDVIQQKFIEN